MKLFNRKRKLIISIILVVLLVVFIGKSVYDCKKDYNLVEETLYDLCSEIFENSHEYPQEIVEQCARYIDSNRGILMLHSNILFDSLYDLALPAVIILILLSALSVYRLFKDKIIINMLVREKYSHVITYVLRQAYSFIWIVPVVIFGLFMVEGYLMGFDNIYNVSGCFWSDFAQSHYILFIICYILNIIFYFSFYINITLFWIRKNYNYIVATISSILTILCMEIIVVIVPGKYSDLFNTMSFFGYIDSEGFFFPIIVSFCWCLLSWVVLYFSYRNKEKLVLDIEKQNEEE